MVQLVASLIQGLSAVDASFLHLVWFGTQQSHCLDRQDTKTFTDVQFCCKCRVEYQKDTYTPYLFFLCTSSTKCVSQYVLMTTWTQLVNEASHPQFAALNTNLANCM